MLSKHRFINLLGRSKGKCKFVTKQLAKEHAFLNQILQESLAVCCWFQKATENA